MKNHSKIVRLNPTIIAPPVGKYSHVTIVPRQASIYIFSGQIGSDKNGYIPEDFKEQANNTFQNIIHLLDSQDLASDDVIKVNIWATKPIEWDYFDTLWDRLFNKNHPSMTVAYVSALGLPEIHLEIEIWAAK